jgi:hypothetical protein
MGIAARVAKVESSGAGTWFNVVLGRRTLSTARLEYSAAETFCDRPAMDVASASDSDDLIMAL